MTTLGFAEWVHLPGFDIGPIRAKLDTGAKTSSLHATNIVVDGDRVRFRVHTIQHSTTFAVDVETELVEHRMVRDSGAKETLRPVVQTILRVGDLEYPIQLTLADRSDMGHRLLLGREALAGRILVDSGAQCTLGVPETVRAWKA